MQNKMKKIICIVCATATLFGFASCGNEQTVISAYDIAVQNGFQGTEKEWLASLKGSDGKDAETLDIQSIYDDAVANGYTGSFIDFLESYLNVEIKEDNDTEMIANNLLSVVSIYCGFTKTVTTSSGFWGGTQSTDTVYASAGSGVVIDLNKEAGNALIVTNYHVVYDLNSNTENKISDSIYLYPYGAYNMFSTKTGKDEEGEGIKATFVGGAMDYDIALLKVEGSEYIQNNLITEAKIGDSEKVRMGEKVFAIGNPDGAGLSVTSGVISVPSEYIEMVASDSTSTSSRTVEYRVMRTDAAINGGNSGGGLFNSKGELIGICNAKNIEKEVDNIGYAIPISLMQDLWENILDNDGVFKRAMFGILVQATDTDAVYEDDRLCIDAEYTVVSTEIESTAAAYGKLRYGDKLLALTLNGNRTEVVALHSLDYALMNVRLGDTLIVTIERDGTTMDVEIPFDKESYFTIYK